ncbi:MAG: hypothetical protein ABUS48_01115 [Pseudomonadota bacterium]
MLLFVWMCVMTSAFFPGGERLAALQAKSYQSHIRASIDRPIMTLGWASRDAVSAAPTPAALNVHEQIRVAQATLEALPAPRPRRRALAA